MSAFSDTQGPETARRVERHGLRDSFWGQTPAAVLAIVAVVAIVFVNSAQRQPAAAPGTEPLAVGTPVVDKGAAAGKLAPAPKADCADCATVLSIQQLQGTGDSGFAVEIRMSDGTRRTVRHFAAGFEPGDAVLVNGNALTLRR